MNQEVTLGVSHNFLMCVAVAVSVFLLCFMVCDNFMMSSLVEESTFTVDGRWATKSVSFEPHSKFTGSVTIMQLSSVNVWTSSQSELQVITSESVSQDEWVIWLSRWLEECKSRRQV